MRRALALLAGATLVAGVAIGCSDGTADTSPTTTAPAVETPTTTSDGPEVTLLDPGAEPRTPLRIRYTAGDQAHIDLTIDQAIDQTVRRGDLAREQRFDSPPVTQGLTYTIDSVDEAGQATFSVAVTRAEAQTEGTELSAEAALLLQAELQPLVGLAGEGTVDDRGVIDRFQMRLPAELDPALEEQIATLDRELRGFGPSLPMEAVGAGARWEITATTTIGGIDVATTTTYTLVDRTAEQISYTATIAGTAEPQKLDLEPGLDLAPEADGAELRSSVATGTSTGTQSLAGLGFTLRTEVSTSQELHIDGPDDPSTITQAIETDLAARTAAS